MKLRYYIFDWDDNVVHMPTRIWMEDDAGQAVPLTTSEFALRRGEPGLHPPGGDFNAAFREFRDETGDFEADLQRAMSGTHWEGPALGTFKEAVMEGRLFAIVTARGHSEDTLRRSVGGFIDKILSPKEKQQMMQHLREFNALASIPVDAPDAIAEYLNLCHFVGVSNPAFAKTSGVASPEEGKKQAIRFFVKRTLDNSSVFLQQGKTISTISFGMSDDDRKNVKAVEELMRDELSPAYPQVKFVVFDTGGGRTLRQKSHLGLRAAVDGHGGQ